ncbi:MAG TPA: EscU/YscU/HrcU family type III secretion system export apparatus switch protein [Deltaproteobacteria bacterium]|nr:EscU/YscU/HrcU family type III secretion system export apparatus switch protein [Deltaproteobacteria bacterium]
MKDRDKDKKAVALKYERGRDGAPKVAAKGRGEVAERILALAKEHGVPVEKDSTLLEALYRLDINEEIPEELYQVVAELLAFIYRMNALKKRGGTE